MNPNILKRADMVEESNSRGVPDARWIAFFCQVKSVADNLRRREAAQQRASESGQRAPTHLQPSIETSDVVGLTGRKSPPGTVL